MRLLLGVLIVVVGLGCADANAPGGGGGGGGGGGVTVSVSPGSVSVAVGGTQQFSAVVSGSSDGAVTWSVSPGTVCGGVSSTGLYQAPSTVPASACQVVATSHADASKSASATVTVMATQAIQVSVFPNPATTRVGGTVQFQSSVTGTSNQAVTWAVLEATGGTITAGGLYTAPGTSGQYTVQATSAADPTKKGTSVVTVTPAPGITLSPSPATVATLAHQPFTATVVGLSSTNVVWSVVEGSTGGRIDSAGSYQAPPRPGTFHVKATSAVDSTVTQTASVTVTLGCLEELPPIRPLTVDAGITVFGRLPVAVDGAGQPFVAWTESFAPGIDGHTSYVARLDGGTWEVLGGPLSQETKVALGENHLDMVLDSAGKPFLAYLSPDTATNRLGVLVRHWNGSSWDTVGTRVGDATGNGARFVSIARTSGDLPVISYSSTASDVVVARWNGSAWVKTTGIASTTGTNVGVTSVVVDSSDNAIVGWNELTGIYMGLGENFPFAQKLTGPGAGFLGTPDAGHDNYPVAPVLGFDETGRLAMAFTDYPDAVPAPGSLGTRVSIFDGGTWSALGSLVPERAGGGQSLHAMALNTTDGRLAVMTRATVDFINAAYQFDGSGWPMVCAPLVDETETDWVARGSAARGLAYDPTHHAYLMAVYMNGANQGRGTVLVNRVTAP